MKIVQLTPGSGGTFYCENCLRDVALAKALRRAGHDLFMVPLYLPPSTDDGTDPANAPVFYGGINVYLQQKLGFFRWTPRWIDRLFDARGLLRWAGTKAGMTSATDLAETTLSMLRGEHGRQAKELARLVAWLKSEEKPDVVSLSNALLLGMARRIRAELGVPVICMLQDEDIFLDALPDAYRQRAWDAVAERAADADAFVAVSRYYADAMIDRLRLPADRVRVIHTGIEAEGYVPAAEPPDPPAIGFLNRMCRVMGLDVLIEAFLILRKSGRFGGLKLRVTGGKTAEDDAFLAECRARLDEAGAGGDVEFVESFNRQGKIALLRSVSVLSVPARHPEAFGLYVLEALAAGVPVALPPKGAFPELVEATGGGVLSERDDAESLAGALAELLSDPARARALGRRGREAVLKQFTTDRQAGAFAAVCRGVAGSP